MCADFLLEIGCEELPPLSLQDLSSGLTDRVTTQLDTLGLKYQSAQTYNAPRRLAVLVYGLDTETAASERVVTGPPLSIAFKDGQATPAATGFAKKCGVALEALEEVDGKLCHRQSIPARATVELLPNVISTAIEELPLPKRMRWGMGNTEFIRPVHWMVALLDRQVIPLQLLEVTAEDCSRGHRFYSSGAVHIPHPSDYVDTMKKHFVWVDADERREAILTGIHQLAADKGLSPIVKDALLEEVTALVEYPVALMGEFDVDFLQLPKEVLITSMESHQKYFPLQTLGSDKLSHHFITISNIDSDKVIVGNQRVIAPRLKDAQFFWQEDLKVGIASYQNRLDRVIYHNQLGSLQDKTTRLGCIGKTVADMLGLSDKQQSALQEAAALCKADLVSHMVIEFTQLQGVIGGYYSEKAGFEDAVCQAIREHYLPIQAGSAIPTAPVSMALALAEKIDIICGVVALGELPTGDKDPYGLRRHALGLCRILIENHIDIPIDELIRAGIDAQPEIKSNAQQRQKSTNAGSTKKKQTVTRTPVEQLHTIIDFIRTRFKYYARDMGHQPQVFDAVINDNADDAAMVFNPYNAWQRIGALETFLAQDTAKDLIAAYKRIHNILRSDAVKGVVDPQSTGLTNGLEDVNREVCTEPAEQALLADLKTVTAATHTALDGRDYPTALQELTRLNQSINCFFDDVIVLADEPAVRHNRIALVSAVKAVFDQIADLSKLPSDSD